MLVPDPRGERVELRLVQVEPKLDGPGLDQVAVGVVVPLKDVADVVVGHHWRVSGRRTPTAHCTHPKVGVTFLA